jgi:flagellar hook-length control protein FliK
MATTPGTAEPLTPATTVSPPTARRRTQAAAQPADAAPATSEPVRRALSLLRVAERGDDLRIVARRAAASDSAAPVAPAADSPVQTSQAPAGAGQPAPLPAAASAATAAPPAPAAALADRIVDIGVSGQWIDRLSREIANIAVTDGTARFVLNPQALGAMQVEIRHGDAGAAIRMLVETEAALNALKDAQPQLKADANLASIRIAEIHVERRALPAEASSTARDQSQQQSAQSGKDQTWTGSQNQTAANPGGSMGAGQGQTAGQPYRKAPLIEAALNGPPGSQTEAGETVAAKRASRARYA